MIENTNVERVSAYSAEFLTHWVTNDQHPNANAINERNWSSIVVADFINAMEAEWLGEAIKACGFSQVVGIRFQHEGNPTTETLAVDKHAILEYIAEYSYEYLCITSSNSEFIFYKDQGNRYFLLCGDGTFLSKAYRCSIDTARIMYFESCADSEFHSKEEKLFLGEIWEEYMEGSL